jgi:LPS sulfotransferase NodH
MARAWNHKLRPSVSYLICCCERTGSTLLEAALIGTGIAGQPRSYFNRVAHYSARMHRILGNAKDDDQYLDRVITAATTQNGVFGAKIHWTHLSNLVAKAEHSERARGGSASGHVPDLLQLHIPNLHYVWLTRKNAVARAISHYRAKKTNRWQVDSRWTTDDDGGEGEPAFDFDEIDALVRLGISEDLQWQNFFREHNISPLELIYEEMIGDLERAVRHVLAYLGIPADHVTVTKSALRKQGDDRSQEWEARYRQICAEESP